MIKREYFIVILVVILLAVGVSADVFFWRHIAAEDEKQQEYWQTKIDSFSAQIKQQEANLSDLQDKFIQLTQNNQQNTQQRALNEIASLLDMANLYLQINHGKNNAVKLLELAQQHLQRLADPRLLPLQKALASDLNRLNEIPQENPTEILLKLQTVAESVLNLPTTEPKAPAPEPEPNISWYKHPWKAWHNAFKKLFTVHHVEKDNSFSPLLKYEWLKEDILLALAQAQWAVLQRNETLYQKNLHQVQQWLTEKYPDTTEREKILNNLSELMTINIAPSLPSITASLEALEEAFKEAPHPSFAPAVPAPTPYTQPQKDQTTSAPESENPIEKTPPPAQGIEI